MKVLATARLARVLWVLALLLAAGVIALMLANLPVRSDILYLALLAPGFSTVGLVIAIHRRNTVGWLFLSVGLVGAVGEYALRTFRAEPGSLPAGPLMAWITSWIVLCELAMVFCCCWCSPTGGPRPPVGDRSPGGWWSASVSGSCGS